MPLPNVRIVVTGAPRADADFDVVEATRAEATRLARLLATDADRAKRELDAILRGPGAGGRKR